MAIRRLSTKAPICGGDKRGRGQTGGQAGTGPVVDATWSYDDLGRLIGEVLDSSDNTLDYTDTFEWDIVGNRQETSRDWGDVANDDYTTTYQYDANGRLTVETKVEGSSTTASTYAYDHTQQTGKSVVTDSREAVAACGPERQFGVRFPREAKSRRDDRMGAILAAEKKRNTKIAKSTKVNVRYFREG